MKDKRFASLFSSVAILSFSLFAGAAKILVVTDQPKALRAQDVAALFRSTPPYSLMKDLELKVIQTSPKKLGCQSSAPSAADFVAETAQDEDSGLQLARAEARDRLASRLSGPMKLDASLPASCSNKDGSAPARLITCDSPQSRSYLSALKKTEKAAYVIVVMNERRYGGSGGEYPVMTSGSPAAMAIHELMHQLGFSDEYSYLNSCEADMYCNGGADSISPSGYGALPNHSYNIAVFTARQSYKSNAEVRGAHGKNIPWLSFIDGKTDLLTSGKIGTPQSGVIGLYRADVCDKASKPTQTWQAVTQPTVMRTLSTTYIPKDDWNTIAKSLGTHF